MKGIGIASALVVSFLMFQGIAKAGEGWMTDFKAALEESAKRGVPILADFSGSDWCGWCIKLDKEVFQETAFKKFAAESFVLFLADFPRSKSQTAAEKSQNQELARKYEIQGFPTVLVLDQDGKVLKRTGYQRGGAAAYIEHLKEALPAKSKPAAPSALPGSAPGKTM